MKRENKNFILAVVQPGLLGLIDGSISTLAPLFATAVATQNSHTTLLVGLAAAVGAAISMSFSEGLSDNGDLTGRGHPILRGLITGLMTFVGGILHTLPFLMSDTMRALDLAYVVVALELLAISYLRYYYFRMNPWSASYPVVIGGGLVFLSGILIGSF